MTSKVIFIVALSIAAGAGLATRSTRSGLSRDIALSSSDAHVTANAEGHSAGHASSGIPNTEQRNHDMNNLATSAPIAVSSLAPDSTRSPNSGEEIKPGSFPPAPVVPLASQPPARLLVDSPLPEQLAKGYVVIRYRTENLRILPVFGPAALGVTPRIGHLHITVDDAPWHWLDASGEPISINGLLPGPHKVLIELEDPTHKVIERKTVHLEIPERKAP